MRYHPLLTSLALAVALAGCQAQGLVGVGAGGATPDAGQQAGKPAAGAPAAVAPKLGAYEFKPLSADAAAKLANRASAGTGEAAAAPMAASADARMTRPAVATGMSILPGSPYAHGTYFTGPYGPMKLESATEAKGPGSAGGWAEIKAQVVAPVLADWTTDARLIASHGMLDADGNTATGEERWPGELGWRATYAAPSRNEVLEFHVTAAGSTITRLKWTAIDLNLDATAVDARVALATIASAVKDEAAKSEEEKLGYDYFFGKDGGMVHIMDGGSGATAVAVAEPAVDVPGPFEPGPASDPGPIDAPAPVAKPLPIALPSPKVKYTLTPGGRWNASLNAIGAKVVWELHYDAGEKAWTPPQDGWAKDPSAYGMVDARTGLLIRLRRPSEFYVGLPESVPSSEPMPRPMI